jgi:hypothetical protein
MIVMTCARCKRDVDRLFETEICFTEMKIGEQPDGQFEKRVELCEPCTEWVEENFEKWLTVPD